MARHKVNVIERILRHLPDCTDEQCWVPEYKSRVRGGYIPILREDGGMRVLHAVVWEAHNAEPVPEGMVVMHTCDNPACCNPHHLVVGTQSDNIKDCVSKGRFSRFNRWGKAG